MIIVAGVKSSTNHCEEAEEVAFIILFCGDTGVKLGTDAAMSSFFDSLSAICD
jgi:hypothetical protein